MTIVAGFSVRDGILLAADTMYTGGSKIHQPKLFRYTINENTPDVCALGFALAGHEDFGKMAIDDCVDEIAEMHASTRTMRNITRALRDAIRRINDEYVDTRPDYEKESAKFELIIGAWLPLAGGLNLFRTRGPAVLPAGVYHCTGTGAYLGDYLMRNVVDQNMSLKQATLLAIQALFAAKTYDANCGGDTQFMVIYPGGSVSAMVPYSVNQSESYIASFEALSRRLMFNVGDGDIPDLDFEKWLGVFCEEMRQIRNLWMNKGWEYLAARV